MQKLVALSILLIPGLAQASIDPKCEGIPKPDDYNEQVQADFLLNYVALATTLSPIHAPVPHEPGHGAIGLDIGIIPPLGCEKRYVLEWTKTEETNKSPVVPRPRVTFAFGEIFGGLVPYAGVAYVPPVPINGNAQRDRQR